MTSTPHGEGLAPVIPFPVERITPAKQDDSVPDESGEYVESGDPVPVEDLRLRISAIESQETTEFFEPVATPTKDATRAKNIALHQLSVSGRSEAEVRDRLAQRELPDEVIEAEVSRLVEVGLIDDEALAITLVESLRRRKKLGDSAIISTLRQRKIPAAIIEQVLADSEGDEGVAVFELAEDRARSMRHLDEDVAFRRLVGYLQRRGYRGGHVFEAARRALQSTQAG